jgi:hypothetical protein
MKKAKDMSKEHEDMESKAEEAREYEMEDEGYEETESGKMVKSAKGGLTKSQKKIKKVMREFKSGTLHSGKKGPVVKNPKQAIAIALSEAGKSKEKKLKPVKAFMGLAAMAAKNPMSGIGLAAKALKKGNKFFGEEIFNERKNDVQKKMSGGMMSDGVSKKGSGMEMKSKGGMVRGSGAAIRGTRPAKLY